MARKQKECHNKCRDFSSYVVAVLGAQNHQNPMRWAKNVSNLKRDFYPLLNLTR